MANVRQTLRIFVCQVVIPRSEHGYAVLQNPSAFAVYGIAQQVFTNATAVEVGIPLTVDLYHRLMQEKIRTKSDAANISHFHQPSRFFFFFCRAFGVRTSLSLADHIHFSLRRLLSPRVREYPSARAIIVQTMTMSSTLIDNANAICLRMIRR